MAAERPLLAALAAIGIASSVALASEDHSDSREPEPAHTPASRAASPAAALPPRDLLAHQLDDQAAVIDRALTAVTDKATAAEATQRNRLRAAYRALQASPGDDALATARRLAAARLLLDRDHSERQLLVDEASQLRTARARLTDEAHQLPAIELPSQLVRPARGKIARPFGLLAHERSRTTLSRRGIDLDVDDASPVVAPAAGTVRYAGPIRGLDQGVILDHGSFLTVLAKLGDAALPVGTQVAAGDRIGRAAHHRVYLEVRIKLGPGGLPIDPEPLLTPTK